MLEAKKLVKTFGGIKAVDKLSFQVKQGTIHAIIGPNGAGKTTLVNMITGVYNVSEGEVLFDGKTITNTPMHKLVPLGMCRTFQNLEICESMSALENVLIGYSNQMDKSFLKSCFRFGGIVSDEKIYKEKAYELLELVGLQEYAHIQAGSLSYGILKKIEILRALAANPKLILLDEPVAGLNPKETEEISNIIKQLVSKGVTVVLIEHDMKMVMSISDIITVMNFGKMLAEGTPSQIANNEEVITAYLGRGVFDE
jgi:branched-chain amino acid transport system ATP-binding protein